MFNPDISGTAKSKNQKKNRQKKKKMNNTENMQFPACCLITTN